MEMSAEKTMEMRLPDEKIYQTLRQSGFNRVAFRETHSST